MFGDTLLGSSSLVRLLERAVAALSKATCVKSHETSRASKARRKLSTRTTTTALLKGVFNLGYEFFHLKAGSRPAQEDSSHVLQQNVFLKTRGD